MHRGARVLARRLARPCRASSQLSNWESSLRSLALAPRENQRRASFERRGARRDAGVAPLRARAGGAAADGREPPGLGRRGQGAPAARGRRPRRRDDRARVHRGVFAPRAADPPRAARRRAGRPAVAPRDAVRPTSPGVVRAVGGGDLPGAQARGRGGGARFRAFVGDDLRAPRGRALHDGARRVRRPSGDGLYWSLCPSRGRRHHAGAEKNVETAFVSPSSLPRPSRGRRHHAGAAKKHRKRPSSRA